MCGIAGFIGRERQDHIVEEMLEAQAYRGPDDRGMFAEQVGEKYIHLGHNRLSIQDLSSRGHQVGVWFYSTAMDRVSLYFIPLQVAVFASLPVLMRSRFEPKFMTLMVIAYYASVYIVWLGFAAWAYMWLPYENILPVWLDGWLW